MRDSSGTSKKRQGQPLPLIEGLCYLPRLTAFFSSAPGVNFATRRAAILMVAPVCGLRPFRAFRCEIEKVPNPIRATRSPFLSAPVMLSTVVSIALAAWVLLMPQPAAMRSIRSALFIVAPGEIPLFSATIPSRMHPAGHPSRTGAFRETHDPLRWKLAASYLALAGRDCQL